MNCVPSDLVYLILWYTPITTICRLLLKPPNKAWAKILQSDQLWSKLHDRHIKDVFVAGWNRDRYWLYSFRLNYYRRVIPQWSNIITVNTGIVFITRYRRGTRYVPIVHPRQLHESLIIERRHCEATMSFYTPEWVMGLTKLGPCRGRETPYQPFLIFPYFPQGSRLTTFEPVAGVRLVNYFTPPVIELV